uniref:PGG domain-containing protein n=1 Tax=Oryza glumipatula TaxID=40148 RepID=A0A0E0AJP8_9ORYZ
MTADMRQQEGGDHRHVPAHDDLLSRLTSQRDNENGSTPLHLAASMNGLPSALYISVWCPVVFEPRRRPKPVVLLLDANESMVYQADNQGMYPIHIAALVGSLETVKILLKRCPDCATLRDATGRTFLHAAVEKKRFEVVNYVCHWKRKERFALILNAQDNNGDTALHRAVHAGNLLVFQHLISCHKVRLDVPNKEGMRPIDVSWSMMPLTHYYTWDPRIHIRTLLLKLGAPYGESRGDLFDDKRHTITVDTKFKGGEEKISENVTTAAQVLALFSVLITTVTFASAFTLPGGFRSAGDGGGAAGTPLLAGRGSYAFDAFILADALAFICSFVATAKLLYAGVPAFGLETRLRSINGAYSQMMNSGRSLVATLALGLYVVLLPPVGRTIAIAIAAAMVMLSLQLSKESEGIESLFAIAIAIPRNWKLSIWDFVVGFPIYVWERYWSFILIFGLPAIRKWARAG